MRRQIFTIHFYLWYHINLLKYIDNKKILEYQTVSKVWALCWGITAVLQAPFGTQEKPKQEILVFRFFKEWLVYSIHNLNNIGRIIDTCTMKLFPEYTPVSHFLNDLVFLLANSNVSDCFDLTSVFWKCNDTVFYNWWTPQRQICSSKISESSVSYI